jgi:hydrogenase maturation protein HypF
VARRAITIHGIVQGVGFRPFVSNLASRLHLGGFVRNHAGSVSIEVEGDEPLLDDFLNEVTHRPPPLAQIERIAWEPCPPCGEREFAITPSTQSPTGAIFISADVATCQDCLRELFDPADRRYRYPFLNCTNCGPRLTIIQGAPYDRPRTTMAAFTMCPACQAEYDDPAHRRFHAQPSACPRCGPRLRLCDAHGKTLATAAPLADFARALRSGSVGAVKGLGGYHLTCAAQHDAAVAELRRRKRRYEKPFALMVRDVASAMNFCAVGEREQKLLQAAAAPIVLLRKRSSPTVACEVAPHNLCLGVMLPYTPLHHLLLDEMAGAPLVMTSGNASDEPIAYQDDDAFKRLAGIADLFLVHDRPIHVRCDDSVVRVVDGQDLPLRRSRGYAPRPLELPSECARPILAVGGQLKGTFALGKGRQAFLSHHLGDLDEYEALRAFMRDVDLFQELFAVRPEYIVHDLHADYASTIFARQVAAQTGGALLTTQHHHAHLASCMAEHGLCGPVIGVTFDGTGMGSDGAVWGGEFLVGDYRQFERPAHFRYVGMPGGERAIREPWRMAAAHLADAGVECQVLAARIAPSAMRTIQRMLARRALAPPTSSAGRLFDAVASLAGVRDSVSYEGQAAIELEALAGQGGPYEPYPFLLEPAAAGTGSAFLIDTRPLIRAVAADADQGVAAADIARRFHDTLVELIARVCQKIRQAKGVETVALTGGVFQNALLSSQVAARLINDGFGVYRHHRVPPNDGGLSLGQLAIGAALVNAD